MRRRWGTLYGPKVRCGWGALRGRRARRRWELLHGWVVPCRRETLHTTSCELLSEWVRNQAERRDEPQPRPFRPP